MDCYIIWCDLKPGVRDMTFVEALDRWLGALKANGDIEGWRVLRKKLGFAPAGFGEFQIVIETRDMAQLDAAFRTAATRADPAESVHHGVSALIMNFQAALYRDFPDPFRKRGEERF
ncbi:MAG: hypothetical protein GC206_13985 [Alphaproteobacteria bacterium]|nr:hypothetical protein [Alphaproteobacteria bacterium]